MSEMKEAGLFTREEWAGMWDVANRRADAAEAALRAEREYAELSRKALEEIVKASRAEMYERCPECEGRDCSARNGCHLVPLGPSGKIAAEALAHIGHEIRTVEQNLAESWMRWEIYDIARSFRDTLCRTLDTAERRTKVGKPLEQDEIDAMTARLVNDTNRMDGLGRPVKPHGGHAIGHTKKLPVQCGLSGAAARGQHAGEIIAARFCPKCGVEGDKVGEVGAACWTKGCDGVVAFRPQTVLSQGNLQEPCHHDVRGACAQCNAEMPLKGCPDPLQAGMEAALSLVRTTMRDGNTTRLNEYETGRENVLEFLEGELIDRIKALTENAERTTKADFAAFVTFNGTRLRWTDRRITYAQAVRTCDASSDLNQLYTVVYTTRGGKAGTLTPGQDTEVEEGMVIDAMVTGRA